VSWNSSTQNVTESAPGSGAAQRFIAQQQFIASGSKEFGKNRTHAFPRWHWVSYAPIQFDHLALELIAHIGPSAGRGGPASLHSLMNHITFARRGICPHPPGAAFSRRFDRRHLDRHCQESERSTASSASRQWGAQAAGCTGRERLPIHIARTLIGNMADRRVAILARPPCW